MKWISVDCLHWSKIRFIHKYLARNLSFYKESLLKIKLWKGFHHIVPKVQKYPRVWKHPAASRVFADEKPLFLRKCSFWEDRKKNGKVGVWENHLWKIIRNMYSLRKMGLYRGQRNLVPPPHLICQGV